MKNILIYNSGGGLGDSIQLFDLVTSLKTNFKDASLFYLGAHENHFQGSLKEYGIDIPTFEMNLKYFGFRWKHLFLAKKLFNQKSIDKFDLIIDLQSKIRNTLILKQIPSDNFYSSSLNYFFSTKKKNYVSTKNNLNMILDNIEKLIDKKLTIQKYNIKSINSKYFDEAKRILPNNNYVGLSVTQGNAYRKKNWPMDKFINLGKKIVEINKVPVFLIKKNDTELISKIKNEIKEAIIPEENAKYSEPVFVTALATRLSSSVTINNGIMHMISLAKTPMILLFGSGGPKEEEKFAPKHSSVKILNSTKLYNSTDINKISEIDVLELI